MRLYGIALLAAVLLSLAACGAPAEEAAGTAEPPAGPVSTETVPEEPPEEEPCVHQSAQGDNAVEHEAAGYCGNTVTTVSREGRAGGEPVSFRGDDSVALTDLLRYLDYSGDICRCLPEYSVDTEFGTGYGVNLTEGYARHGGGQTALTEEQTSLIREILVRQGAPGTAEE